MPATPDPPKSGPSRRRRILKWTGRFLIGMCVLASVALLFLPQIATRLIKQFTSGLELARCELTVAQVKWNEALLVDLEAADGAWRVRAKTVVVRYHPWDLLRGKVRELTIHNCHLAFGEDDPGPGPAKSAVEVPAGTAESSWGWLHALPETLTACPEISAPGARLTIPRGPATSEIIAHLALNRASSRRLTLSLASDAQGITADLENTASGSTLHVQLSASDPGAWLTTTEALLGAATPYLPAELVLGPLEGKARLLISDKVDSIEVAGFMKDLRYAGSAPSPEAQSSRTTFEGSIRPRGRSEVDLHGELSRCAIEVDAIPGGVLTVPAGPRPTWKANLEWDANSFTYDGALENLRLRGRQESRPLEVTGGSATFSNREASFRTGGRLRLDKLTLPFDFVLNPAAPHPSQAPNATLQLGPVTLDGPQPLLAALLPSGEPPALFGTFDSSLALRLASGEPVSGTLDLSVSEASYSLAGDFVSLGPLSGRGQVRLPAGGKPPTLRFEGNLASLKLGTTDALGFPLAHRQETPAEIKVRGELAREFPRFRASVQGLSLEGKNNGQQVQFPGTSLDIDYRGPHLTATALTHFGTTPLACKYEHTIVKLRNDQWRLNGVLALSSAIVTKPITNAGAFSELLDGISLAGKIASELKFQAASNHGFEGTLQMQFSDCTAALEDDLVAVRGLSGAGTVTIPAGEETPVSWKIEGTAGVLAIDTSDSLGFPLAHTADPPAAFAISGIVDDDTTTRGTISKLTLDGEHRGEFVSFAETDLEFILAGDSLSAKGTTNYAGNEVPFAYHHTRKATPDENWRLEGKVTIPLVTLAEPVTNAGAFSEAAAGVSFSGKAAAETTFRLASDDPFRGDLDLSVLEGTLTLPDDGPILEGVGVHFVTPDLHTLHTVKPERFAIKSLTYGDLSLTDLAGRYQIHPDGGIAVSGFDCSFLGGRLAIDPFTYPDDDTKPFRVGIRLKRLKLRALTALFPAFDGRLDGTIDGHLPILRKNGSFLPERGGIHLTPRTKAHLRYNADALFTGGLSPGSAEFKRMKIAEDSLKNLKIGTLSGRFFDPGDEDKAAVIRIEGQSPTIEGAPPIHLNFNFFEPDGEFRQLVDYFFKNREKLDFGL